MFLTQAVPTLKRSPLRYQQPVLCSDYCFSRGMVTRIIILGMSVVINMPTGLKTMGCLGMATVATANPPQPILGAVSSMRPLIPVTPVSACPVTANTYLKALQKQSHTTLPRCHPYLVEATLKQSDTNRALSSAGLLVALTTRTDLPHVRSSATTMHLTLVVPSRNLPPPPPRVQVLCIDWILSRTNRKMCHRLPVLFRSISLRFLH